MPTLFLTPRFSDDSQALWRAASRMGWNVERLTSWRVPENARRIEEPVLYLESLFGQSIAEQMGVRLLEPEVDWLPDLHEMYRKRSDRATLGEARSRIESAFIKPPVDKSFPAKVYVGSELPQGYDESSPVLVAEVISWEKEFRCFVLDRECQTMSIYFRNGELQKDQGFEATFEEMVEATRFLEAFLSDKQVLVPRATVIDIGIIANRGWAVVEQNPAWGSGIYGCDPEKVLEVLRCAVIRD